MSEIVIPKISSITLPSSVNINQKFSIRVFVTENTITIIPYELFVGDLCSGEV